MTANRQASPARIAAEAGALGQEAATVIALRSARLAKGDAAARREAQRMVTEKVEAAWHLSALAMTGGLGWTPADMTLGMLRFYRKGVRANRRRLGAKR